MSKGITAALAAASVAVVLSEKKIVDKLAQAQHKHTKKKNTFHY